MASPIPDPLALRRDRKDDQATWTLLPREGYLGAIPEFPLQRISIFNIYWVNKERVREFDEEATKVFHSNELELWEALWRKPQAAQWIELGLEFQVAAYTRAFLESNFADATSGHKTAVLRMEDGLGISIKGLNTLRWKIVADEVKAKRAKKAVAGTTGESMRNRLKAVPKVGA